MTDQLFAEAEHGVTLRTIWDVHNATASELLGPMDRPVGEDGRPGWRASMIGGCLRRQYLWRLGVPETRVETPDQERDKLARFASGHRLEKELVDAIELAGVLIGRQVSVHDDELAMTGMIDALWGGHVSEALPDRSKWWSPDYTWAVQTMRGRMAELVPPEGLPVTGTEVKSTHSYAVRRMYKEGPRFDFRAQSGTYLLLCRRNPGQLASRGLDRFEIAVVGRDTVKPLIFGVTSKDVELAEDRIGRLNEAWASKEPPPCECAGKLCPPDMTWQQAYCSYLDPDDPTACCGTTLLDLLTQSVEATKHGT